jgi:hypothetical protein
MTKHPRHAIASGRDIRFTHPYPLNRSRNSLSKQHSKGQHRTLRQAKPAFQNLRIDTCDPKVLSSTRDDPLDYWTAPMVKLFMVYPARGFLEPMPLPPLRLSAPLPQLCNRREQATETMQEDF